MRTLRNVLGPQAAHNSFPQKTLLLPHSRNLYWAPIVCQNHARHWGHSSGETDEVPVLGRSQKIHSRKNEQENSSDTGNEELNGSCAGG